MPRPSHQTPAADQLAEARAESARYVLFGRILPALRHALVGELQALRFGVKLAESGSSGADVLPRLGEQVTRSIARAEALTRWFQPDGESTVYVGAAVDDCLGLVRTEWQIRGIQTRVAVAPASSVGSQAFREILVALLIALGDELTGPADVTLRARRRGNALVVKVSHAPAAREGDEPGARWPRRLRWEDVDALARTHAVRWTRRSDWIAARFPVAGNATQLEPPQGAKTWG